MADLEWTLTVNGDSTTLTNDIISWEFSTSLDMIDALTVEVNSEDLGTRDKVIKLCQPGVTWALKVGTKNFSGDVVGVTWESGKDGVLRLYLHGLEKLHRLRNQPLFEVAKTAPDKIAGSIGSKHAVTLTATALTAPLRDSVLLDDTGLAWIKRLADSANYAIFLDGTSLKFAPRDVAGSGKACTVDYDLEVISTRIRTDLTEVATSVTVIGRDYMKDQAPFKYKSAAADLKKLSGTDTAIALRNKTIGALDMIIDHQGRYHSTSLATDRAKAELQRRAETFLSGSIVCKGVEASVATKVTLKNAPWPLKGPFFISGVTWSMNKGMELRTTLDVMSDSLPPNT
ncbi:MAG TPA: hypothetical protein PKY30_02195 [Myxococcota bacterium]|nr:hypothetical protein [Myxococcota bacterium]HNH45815.1 hypothetical protein [Myxococcota bacterium]